jgi:uncharacterized membrane protein YozB (DUF420 family)
MAITANGGFAPRPQADRNAFLLFTALGWTGVLVGFGSQIAQDGFDYPLIVHLHAAVFVGWLALFTAQVSLIRAGNYALHRRLGVVAVVWACAVLVVGPATAITMDALHYAAKGKSPIFMSVQFTDILAFAGLTGAGLLLRRDASAHKRLMLLGTLYITDAGFARWFGGPVEHLLGRGFEGFFFSAYLANDILFAGVGAYDLVTRRRLHPAYVIGVAWALANQLAATSLYFSPAWKPVAMRLIGH